MSATVERGSASVPTRPVSPRAGAGFPSWRRTPREASECDVLLVEDDPTSANALRVLLTMHGCEVAIARSLEQGLYLLHARPKAIVVDLMLPDGDGIEILARVREANLPIKVVVTTAVGDPARLAAVYRLNPDCILRKPMDLGDLLRALGVA